MIEYSEATNALVLPRMHALFRSVLFPRRVHVALSATFAGLATVTVVALPAQVRQVALHTVPVLPTTRMDAGVKVFQHDRTAFTRATQLELIGPPLSVIGGADGDTEHDLTYAFYVGLLSDGRVTTLSPIGNKYYVFGSDGKYQHTLGQQGKGPGEFTRPSGNIILAGDTLFISDDFTSQFSWFHPDKGFVRARARGVDGRQRSEKAVGVLPGGRVVMTSSGLVQNGEPNKLTRPTAPVSLVTFEGKSQPVAQVPDLELYQMNVTRRGQSHPETLVRGFTPRAVVGVWDSTVVTGTGDRYQLDVHNSTGTIISRVMVNTPRVAVTREMRDARIELMMRRYRNMPGEGGIKPNLEEIEKIERDTPVADSLPAYNQFFTTANGTLWVVDAVAPKETGWTATAFRRDGAIIGRLIAKGKGTPLAFGDDRVVIRSEDNDGVVTLTVRRIGVAATKPT
ncbi:MAG: 6-bladed beta-propeller [Gemmatimonas sp.]